VDQVDDVLSRTPLFEALDEDGASALRAEMHNVDIARGERLFDEGDVGDKLYVALEGKIKLTRTAVDGRENLLSVIGPGEMFGELSLFDPRPRTQTATALTDSRLAALDHQALRDWLTGRPDLALHLLRGLAQRLRRTNEVMTDLVFTDVPGRVAKALLDLADRFGMQRPDGLQVNHDLTQEELAQLVGASRETVNKALADFVGRGWIQLSAKSVLLVDPDRLRRRARLAGAGPGAAGADPRVSGSSQAAARPAPPGRPAEPGPTTGQTATATDPRRRIPAPRSARPSGLPR
jgi:CRP/FNR family transcriptional regulator, cyclic AMP receptor protein